MGHDADEPRSQSALGHKSCGRVPAQDLDLVGDTDILGEVEIMDASFLSRSCDRQVAVIGEAGDHGDRSMPGEIVEQSGSVVHIEVTGSEIEKIQILAEPEGDFDIEVSQMHGIVPALREQTGD